MNPQILHRAGLLAIGLALVACGPAREQSAIRKVQSFHLKTANPQSSRDPMILSETRKRMWGAVTNSERADRLGNYYVVHWHANDKGVPAKVVMEYRQANTGSKVFKQEVDYPSPARSNKTAFTVTGPAYQTQGRVVSWRVQVLQGGEVIGQETSFLWD